MRRLAAVALAMALPWASPTGAHASRPPLFAVGAAVRSINPPVPVFAGGFGLSPPVTKVRDPLQVRAFYVRHGHDAVALAVVDSQAYFSGYQEGPRFGITADRREAARRISALGHGRVGPEDIIVQATHSHAAATLEGIWGPVPLRYLRLVHRQVVGALAQAARSARPAELRWATISDPNIAGENIDQDSYEGWTNDTQISALWAVDPRDGSTIATFDSVPVHGAHICGACDRILSADYFGAVRARLDRALGGVNVVGPATLGREESPVETTGADNMEWLSGIITSDVEQALARSTPVTSTRVGGTERMVHIPAANAALLALNDAWALPAPVKEAEAKQTGIYPIDRANTPPYRTGDVLGTWLTALRIGDLAFVSMPGEPFPEIRAALASATSGAAAIVALSKGQDDFGYFYPAWVEPFTAAYGSDHLLFNVAPQAGDQIVAAQEANLGRLGFQTDVPLETPLPTRVEQKVRPGLQAMASPPVGDAGRRGRFRTTLQAIFSPASILDRQAAGPVRWDFGDGTHGMSGYLQVGQDYGQTGQGEHGVARFTHAYRPGAYRVTARAVDSGGTPSSWSFEVRVYPRLRARIAVARTGGGYAFAARAVGGDGTVLAGHWRFAGGGTASGVRVVHRFPPGVTPAARLVIVDGTGTRASTSWP